MDDLRFSPGSGAAIPQNISAPRTAPGNKMPGKMEGLSDFHTFEDEKEGAGAKSKLIDRKSVV